MIDFDDFLKVDIRVGRIIRSEDFPQARNPAYKLWVDFGEVIGTRKTSAQITQNYMHDDLKDKLVLGVVNFPPKQIASFMSEVLVLGVPDENNNVALIVPDKDIPIGGRLY